jgi:hypothetical protein
MGFRDPERPWEPVVLAETGDGASGETLLQLHDALLYCCRGDPHRWSWLQFRFESSGSQAPTGPWYRLTAQWIHGDREKPQVGPRAELFRQVESAEAFVAGYLARTSQEARRGR